MSLWGSVNTGSSVLPNAVDATAWPGSFNASTVAPGTAGAFWSCPVLYPSPDCGRQPRLTPEQVTGLISNLSAMAQCLGDYIATRDGTNLVMESCPSSAASFQLLGTLMCGVIQRIQDQFNNLHPPAGVVSSTGELTITASGPHNQNFDLGVRDATTSVTGVSRAATGPEVLAGTLSDVFVSPSTLQGALAAIQDLRITNMTFNGATGELVINRSDGATFTVVISDAEVGTTTAPTQGTDPSIPTSFVGTNTFRLGAPQQWFLINGKRVPAYD